MANVTVTKCNVYRGADDNWYFAIWCGDEYDTNGVIDDAETEREAVEWAESQWPSAVVRVVDRTE